VHDWTVCPFAHPGERAKRRDPRKYSYDCEMCPAIVRGEACRLGNNCPHSHHVSGVGSDVFAQLLRARRAARVHSRATRRCCQDCTPHTPTTHAPQQVFESFLHPQKYRTLLCKEADTCKREICFFGACCVPPACEQEGWVRCAAACRAIDSHSVGRGLC
jgi:hypothetical protein